MFLVFRVRTSVHEVLKGLSLGKGEEPWLDYQQNCYNVTGKKKRKQNHLFSLKSSRSNDDVFNNMSDVCTIFTHSLQIESKAKLKEENDK